MSINRVTISGNLTKDPETRNTAGGTAVMKFGIAVNDRRKNPEGYWTDYANFVECTLFGARATALQDILHKGMKVCIDGKLQYSFWEDKETHKNRSKIEVIVNELDFMSTKNGSQPASSGPSSYQAQESVPSAVSASNQAPASSHHISASSAPSGSPASASSAPAPAQDDSASFDADIPF
ncbi:MAG: single-stranded DNA-binding protein [Eggerthellaceae bacterium]|nr:single-stranded DNA-binding protein [Eggerthellaceae bacterium]